MKLYLILLCCLFGLFEMVASGSKILFVCPFPAPSHLYVNKPLMVELLKRNHEVHVLAPTPVVSAIPKGAKVFQFDSQSLSHEAMKEYVLNDFRKTSDQKTRDLEPLSAGMCEALLSSPAVQTLVKGGVQYDLAIVDYLVSECAVSLSMLLAKHTMYLSTANVFSWTTTQVPTPPSFVPESFGTKTSRMSFCERMHNAYEILYTRCINDHTILPAEQKMVDKYIPNAPNVQEAFNKVKFILTNADPVMNSPRPSMPYVVHAGGMHCGDPKPLTKEFQDYVDNSGPNGFMMFGLGSNARSEFLPSETINAFVTAFGRLKLKVIWKFEDKLANLPPNVKITNWMPQQDLLGHPKNRLFITHGGLLSLQESIYHGVPVIGIPLFAEQFANVARIQELGIGEKLSLNNITADGVYEVVSKVLNDKRYSDTMKKYSAIFKDQPQKPIDRAVFWTEYVIRHNGAEHLRSPGEHLNFFQYFLLDVAGFILVLLAVILATFCFIIKIALKAFFGSKKVHEKKKKV